MNILARLLPHSICLSSTLSTTLFPSFSGAGQPNGFLNFDFVPWIELCREPRVRGRAMTFCSLFPSDHTPIVSFQKTKRLIDNYDHRYRNVVNFQLTEQSPWNSVLISFQMQRPLLADFKLWSSCQKCK